MSRQIAQPSGHYGIAPDEALALIRLIRLFQIDTGAQSGTVFSILGVALMKQLSTQMSSSRACRAPRDRLWPVKWAFWQTEMGTPAAPLHRTEAKSLLQFRVDESVH